ncbi:hypothetical protein STEG23_028153 [Scotinomys teguina]
MQTWYAENEGNHTWYQKPNQPSEAEKGIFQFLSNTLLFVIEPNIYKLQPILTSHIFSKYNAHLIVECLPPTHISIYNFSTQRPKGPRSTQTAVDKDDSRAPRPHWIKRPSLAPLPKAKMGRRQCKSTYNIIKNKTTPESSPPPTPRSDYCNADKAEENDLKKSLMKMLEEAFEEKMKNVSKEIGENTNKKLEEINKEIEEKKNKKLEEMNNESEEKKIKRVEEMNKEIEEKRKKLQELDKEMEEKINKKLKEMNKEIEEKMNKNLEEINKVIEEKTNKKLEKSIKKLTTKTKNWKK